MSDEVTIVNNENPPIDLEITTYTNEVGINFLQPYGDMLKTIYDPAEGEKQVAFIDDVNIALAGKVDKVSGKGLSTNDLTDALKTNLQNQSGTNTGDETTSTIKTKLGITTLSGSNTGDQAITQFGTCSTASATTEKTVTLSGFSLTTGEIILVTFTNANTATTPTLNVNSTGAKAIYNEAGSAIGANNPAYFPAGSTVEFTYNGTYWVFKKRCIENYVNGASWYRVWSDGWIEQGGIYNNGSAVRSINVNITLLKAHKDTNYSVSSDRDGGNGYASIAYSHGRNTTNFTGLVYGYDANGTSQYYIWSTAGY